MGNPKKADMELHTKQKVAIYDAYLKRYLKIITNGGFPRINLFDPCAGRGSYGECEGSAMTACNNIRAHNDSAPKFGFHLYLNEPDEQNRKELEKVCTYPFVECIDNTDAKTFISRHCQQETSGHRLWFIDPYGYTQICRDNITQIMEIKHSEVLLFIPLTFIYRFLNGDFEKDTNLRSVATFLKDYSLDQKEARSCASAPAFADLISKRLQEQYKYYSWHATMKEGSLYYSLVFIGKHHYGLEKFLEARDQILKDQQGAQYSLIPMGGEQDVYNLIRRNNGIDNCNLYILGLSNGFTPAGLRNHSISLQDRELIHIQTENQGTRRKNDFYLAYKYYKREDRRIKVFLAKQQTTLL